MAVFYLSSVNGSDGNNGTPNKTDAKATWAAALGAMGVNDTLRVDKAHTESFSITHTLAFPGADTTPNIIISIDWASDTYSKATTAQIDTTTSSDDVKFTGSAYHYGMYYSAFDELDFDVQDIIHILENCTLEATSAAGSLRMGHASGGVFMELIDTEIKGDSASDGIFFNNDCSFIWRNGPNNNSKYTNPGTQPTFLFNQSDNHVTVDLSGVDLSVLTTTLFNAGGDGAFRGTLRNCILDSGVALVSGFTGPNDKVFSMVGCDDTTGNDLYRTEIADYYGTTVTDDANYNNDGASDGVNNISWKMVSNANALEFHFLTRSHWISGWINSTGSKTFLIETNSENVTFQDDELWMELEFLDNAADPQISGASDRMTHVDSTPVDQTDSAADPTWTTPGITTEKKQQLSITKTVNRVGPFRARVCLAKPSATVWIDPLVTVS